MEPRAVALRIPDFKNPLESDDLKMSPEVFRKKTTGRMIENLTTKATIVSNFFTSMLWYVRLSRCGLVLSRNIPLEEVYETESALYGFQIAEWNDHLKKKLKAAVPRLNKHRLLTLGQAQFYLSHSYYVRNAQLEKIRKPFEE